MNTFHDLREKLIELYNEALEEYPEPEEEKTIFNPDTGRVEKYVSTEKENYIIEKIKNMEEDYQYKFLSLLALYYFIHVRYSQQDEDSDLRPNLTLYNSILEDDLDDVIKSMLEDDDENDLLFDALTLILEVDIDTLDEKTMKTGKIEDYEEYCVIDEMLENKEDQVIRAIYEEFHPNVKQEAKNHREYKYNIELNEKFNTLSANSLADFITKFTTAKYLFTKKKYLEIFLYSLLVNVKSEDMDLFEKIYLFLVKNYYITKTMENASNADEQEYIKLEALSAVSVMPDINMEIESTFADFDFTTMMNEYYKLPKANIKELESVASLDYKKVYGTEGKWTKYTENQKEMIYKFNYNWYSRIEDVDDYKNINIYYSVNENDCYCIPRLCVITNDDNEVVDILGRRGKLSVEPEMLKTLDIYTRRFKNYEDIELDIGIIKRLREIEKKVDNNEELSKIEIEFLFEMECELPTRKLFNVDIYNKKIQAKSNIKKLFAKYFDCTEDEVAERVEELSNKTKVALFDIYVESDTFPYPNLVAVYGVIHGEEITSSNSLENLKYARGIYLPNIKDKTHLQESIKEKLQNGPVKRKRK